LQAKLKAHYWAPDGQTRFEEEVGVEFRELTDGEAPLAVESADAMTRWFNGRHFRRYTLNSGIAGQPQGERDADVIVDYLQTYPRPYARGYMQEGLPTDRQPSHGTLLNGYLDIDAKTSDRKFSEKRYPLWVDDPKRQIAIAGAQRFADDCIVVDKQFWVACAEPKLFLDERRVFVDTRHRIAPLVKQDRNKIVEFNMNDVPLDGQLLYCTFGLTEVDELRELASMIGFKSEIPDFTIHLPSSLLWDRRDAHLLDAGRLLLAQWEGRIEDIPPEVGHALFKVSACLWNRSNEQVNRDELWDALMEAVSAHRKNRIGAKVYERVCDEWSNRPIFMEMGKSLAHIGRERPA
jgi:hypothetical protein